MNFIFILLLIAGVGWIIWRWRVKDKMALEQAWRLVLEDPNYEHLAHSEKRRAEEDALLRKEEGL